MAKLEMLAGSTSQTVYIFIQDSSKTNGAGLTGLAFGTSGLTAYYVLSRAASAVIALATLAAATSAWATGGFKEVDATNMPGIYRLDLPDAVLASGRSVLVYLQGATNMAPCVIEIELCGWNNQDGVHGGMSALPNTACTTNASLLTSGTGTDQLSVSSGRTNIGKILDTAISTPATAGILDVNVKNMNNVAATAITTIKAVQGLTTADTIATYTGNTPQTGDSYARIGAAGVGLTNLGDTRIAHLDADISSRSTLTQTQVTGGAYSVQSASCVLGDTRVAHLDADVSSRMATYAQPTGFLAATFPAGTIANTTNITAGTITTATNLTNAPANGDFTSAMKTSLNNATPVCTVSGDLSATMKTSVTTACTASTPTAAAVTGSVGSVVARVMANTDQLAGQTVTAAAGVTFPASVASPTNITAGTITTVTNLTNAPTAGDFTATMKTSIGTAVSGSAVASVTGNVGGNVAGSVGSVTAGVTVTTNNDKTGYSLAQGFPSNFAALGITAGGHIGTVDTLTTYTGNTPQTGDSFARIGAAGAGLTNIGDTRIANLDAAMSSRLATSGYTAPDNADIAAIKTQTDKMAFTVSNQIDANIHSVNDVTVTGNGTKGHEWGPA